jgi:hypothetical protein
MRNWTLPQAEDLFNRIEAKKAKYIHSLLQSVEFVTQHFPYHDTAARRETSWLVTAQNRLMEEFAQ